MEDPRAQILNRLASGIPYLGFLGIRVDTRG
jgi:hypothetical protein